VKLFLIGGTLLAALASAAGCAGGETSVDRGGAGGVGNTGGMPPVGGAGGAPPEGGAGGETTCPPATGDCVSNCNGIATIIDGLMCPNEQPYDVQICIQTCASNLGNLPSCKCEYQASLFCQTAALCWACQLDDSAGKTPDCCTAEDAALIACMAP
jgi:hypothetical protein